MSFAFIEQQDKRWAKRIACESLSVSRSGFYAWSSRRSSGEASPRQKRHQELIEQVRLSFLRSRQRYGAPRIAADLVRRGTRVCVNTVAKILHECGWSARPRRRFVPRTTDSNHGYGIAPDRLRAAGAGMIAPVATNDDEAGRAKNRRVELHIVNS